MRIIHSGHELASILDANAPANQILPDFDPHEWLENPEHLALAIDHDLAMFEHGGGDRWVGHIWFRSRGKLALERASILLSLMFRRFGAKAILGEIPANRKDVALFMARLGFETVGKGRHECGVPVNIVCLSLGEQRTAPIHAKRGHSLAPA